MRVLGYVRVSTDEQSDSGAGLEAQRRAIIGPEAHKPPTRGFGIGGPRRPSFSDAMQKARLLKSLDDLRAHGLLTDEEHAEKRAKLLSGDGPGPEQP